MIEEKQLLIKSMHKIIKHVQLGPKNQAEIFASFSSRDIQKIVKNIEDSNIQLRKASFSLLVHLLSGKNCEFRNKFCIHFKIPFITGKTILNPKVLSNLDPLDLREIINLIKIQNNSDKQYDSMSQLLWYINLVDYPIRFQDLTINIVDKIDPKYCIFGITVLSSSSDNSEVIYSESLKAQQQTRSSLHGNNMILMENFGQQSSSTDFPQSQINTNFLKSNMYNKPQISSLQFEKRTVKQKSKDKIVLSHRQHPIYQQNIRQNNSLDKCIKSPIASYKNAQYTNKKVENSSSKEANNLKNYQNHDLSTTQIRLQSQSHEKKIGQGSHLPLNNYLTATSVQNTHRTYKSPYNLQNPHQYAKNRQKEKIYPTQYYQSSAYRLTPNQNPDNQFKTEAVLSPTYYKSIFSPNSPNLKSIPNYNTQFITNYQAKSSNFAHSMNFSQSNTGKKQYYSINDNHLPSSQSNTRPVVYLNNIRPREQVRYNYQYSRQY